MPSLLPGIKTADKDTKFLQDHVLDTMGPVSQLFEHISGLLAETQPGGSVVLSYEQAQELGAITSNAPFARKCLGSSKNDVRRS